MKNGSRVHILLEYLTCMEIFIERKSEEKQRVLNGSLLFHIHSSNTVMTRLSHSAGE